MISRRLLRIKVLQVLYAFYTSAQKDQNNSEKELHFSINKAFELYNYLLILVPEVTRYAEDRIEIAKNKRMPTYSDLHPNNRLVENKLTAQIACNNQLNKYTSNNHISWVKYPELIKELYNKLINSDIFLAYMESEDRSYQNDKKIISRFFTDIVLPNEMLHQILEEQSIYWNDDLEYIISMVIKTISRFNETDMGEKDLLNLYKNKEDKDFIIELFRNTISSRTEYLKMIEETANNWDLDRIAFMDILVMQLALTEFLQFPSIPTKVTLNEYLDIAKYYSTDKSNTFINGVLDKILAQLRAENKIQKTGRGLIGEA